MRTSRERILTTHVGSLIRPPALQEIMRAKQAHKTYDHAAYEACLRDSVAGVVRRQVEVGIDAVSDGEYAVRHNPPPYFTKLRGCATFDVPYTRLASDLSAGKLPAFSFVTPNLIDDMHDGTVADGDNWLAANLPTILTSREYTSGSTAVFITWDEGEGGTATKCATNKTDVGCHVATLVISPSTKPGTRSAKLFNHYSLLGTAEQLLGLPALGRAAAFPTMTSAFNL